jgi:hypothetical protein
MYSRFQKASTPPRVLTIAGSAIALALACWYEIDSEDGTYTPSIIMLSLMWLAPGLIAVGLDLLFMLYALATLIVVSLPLGKNTTLKNMWIPVIFSISSVAGHWMKEKANVKENITYDVKNFQGSVKWLVYSGFCGLVALISYAVAWSGSEDYNAFWAIGVGSIAIYLFCYLWDYMYMNDTFDNQQGYKPVKGFLDYDFEYRNVNYVILKLSVAMASTVFVGAMLAKAEYSGWSIVALIAWIFAIFSIHRAKKYFEDYYVYKKY